MVARLQSVQAVIYLFLASPLAQPPHVSFISLISAVARWPFERPVPEASLNSPELSAPQEHSFSQYVSEQLLMSGIAQRPCLRSVIIRRDQLSGPLATGAWAHSHRFLHSADVLGCVPCRANIQLLRWLPVIFPADILLREVVHGSSQPALPCVGVAILQDVCWTVILFGSAHGYWRGLCSRSVLPEPCNHQACPRTTAPAPFARDYV